MLIQILLPFCLLFKPAIPCDTDIKEPVAKFIVHSLVAPTQMALCLRLAYFRL